MTKFLNSLEKSASCGRDGGSSCTTLLSTCNKQNDGMKNASYTGDNDRSPEMLPRSQSCSLGKEILP